MIEKAQRSERIEDSLYKRDCLDMLMAVSPLDGRYHSKTAALQPFFSEYGIIKARIKVEVEWLIHLSIHPQIEEVPRFSDQNCQFLRALIENFDLKQATRVKDIERVTNHDVKAVEYYLKEKVTRHREINMVNEFFHFACTSEDINNLAHALVLSNARNQVLLPEIDKLLDTLCALSQQYAEQPMLAHTHGQPASPTTMGKELGNVVIRIQRVRQQLATIKIYGKFNGAVGNFNAHLAAYPEVDWPACAEAFVSSLGLRYQAYTTQIEPHDYIAEFCHTLSRFNTILLDLDRDIWGYISIGYFKQKIVEGEVGSSTMPHKVNPIDFENSEGNLGLSNAVLLHLAEKLPISRWQRDLTDSTVMRNMGVGVGYSLLGISSTIRGLNKLGLNLEKLNQDLEQNWIVLAETIQTVMRRHSIDQPYEKLKALTRGQHITKKVLQQFIETLEIPEQEKQRLLQMTPQNYIGNAIQATHEIKQNLE